MRNVVSTKEFHWRLPKELITNCEHTFDAIEIENFSYLIQMPHIPNPQIWPTCHLKNTRFKF